MSTRIFEEEEADAEEGETTTSSDEEKERGVKGSRKGRNCAICCCVSCFLCVFIPVLTILLTSRTLDVDVPKSNVTGNWTKTSGPLDWSILGVAHTSASQPHPVRVEVTIHPSNFLYMRNPLLVGIESSNVDLYIYVPLKATSADISWYGADGSLMNSTTLELFGANPAWCSLAAADSAEGCSYDHGISGSLVAGKAMYQHARELNLKGVQILSYEVTRSESQYELYTIRNDAVENEVFYARSGSVFPESLQGLWWMDQRGTSLPLKSDPDYRQNCPMAAEEIYLTAGEAGWNPKTLCATGVSQYSGGPLSGQWAWLNAGNGTSAGWSAGGNWNAEYVFCYRDSSMTRIDVLMQLPTPWNTIIYLPTWINNVGMIKKPWGYDRITTVGPAWFRSIVHFLGIDRITNFFGYGFLPVFGEGCHYPVFNIVNGTGDRTEYYASYLAYVNNDTTCEESSYYCPRNRGNGTQVLGRLAGPVPF